MLTQQLRDLYQEVILDHTKNPRNFGKLSSVSHDAKGHNPLCGDRLELYLFLDGERIEEVSFVGAGCAISTASASMMTETLKGKTAQEAEALIGKFQNVVTFNDTGFHKPAKEPFLRISEKLNLDLSECMMVGDWPDRDIKGAKQVGMKTAFAKYGSTENISDSGADHDLNSISELIGVINSYNK